MRRRRMSTDASVRPTAAKPSISSAHRTIHHVVSPVTRPRIRAAVGVRGSAQDANRQLHHGRVEAALRVQERDAVQFEKDLGYT